MNDIRLSNFELLRIIAIFFVLLGHAHSIGTGLPSQNDIVGQPLVSFVDIFVSSIALGGVNLFILLSGWFGIKPTVKGFIKLLFQILFLLWLIYLFEVIAGYEDFSFEGVKICFGLFQGYWFIMAYLGLYILAPVLNAFVNNALKKEFGWLLFTFYLFQCYYSWISSMVSYFEGYSITLFCGLYLTARYFRRYPISAISEHPLLVFIVGTILISVLATISIVLFGHASRMLRYDNPLEIISCIGLLAFFSKYNYTNRFVNWLAASCFAVYIIHFNPFVFRYFLQGVRSLYTSCSGVEYCILLCLYLLLTLFLCILVDQIRKIIWNLISKK